MFSRTSAAGALCVLGDERPLLRYFPELRSLGDALPRGRRDGEVVIVRDGALDFDGDADAPSSGGVADRRLSAEIPAAFVAFDVLVWAGEPVWQKPLSERRAALERIDGSGSLPRPATSPRPLDRFESLGLDGVVAKRLSVRYSPGHDVR